MRKTKAVRPKSHAPSGATASPASLRPALPFPVVAIGASAGGLAAFTLLLKALPAKSGMAFVLIQHLEPKHESALAGLLSKASRMPVVEVSNGIAVQPDHVYVIPPNKGMKIHKGALHLEPRPSGLLRPIDDFCAALAEEQGSAAIGVVLSGTGSDGTIGLRAIKAAGGVTFAQDPKTAQWPTMPMSAITGGAVDFALPIKRIAAELTSISRHPYLAEINELAEGSDLDPICLLVRSLVGIDLRLYKQPTVRRRITRRMALHSMKSLSQYGRFLKNNPDEARELTNDIFIHVTSFFRDPECFLALNKKIIPALYATNHEDPVRIWVAGCSTGEEVYSIAMLLLESAKNKANRSAIQIFATDIDNRAVNHARAGVYSEEAVTGLSPARLKRFFVKTDHGYQIQQFVRDLCVFARHDLAKDPPFSRLDLISCRNVLIYMGPALQKRVLSIFEFALRPGGFLFLGKAESVNDHASAFAAEDQKHRLYRRKAITPVLRDLTPVGPRSELAAPPRRGPDNHNGADFRTEAENVLLQHFVPPAVVIDPGLHILHFQGDTSPYLTPATGRPSFHVLKMVRTELALDLGTAITRAAKKHIPVQGDWVEFEHRRQRCAVRFEVYPLKKRPGGKSDLLVVFQPAPAGFALESTATVATQMRGSMDAKKLARDLASSREQLRTLIAEYEITREQMKVANEEALSSNEELQSTNEELETAQEELQASNEELISLNEELQHRNAELNVLTNELTSLLIGVNIPVVVLDSELRVRRFTPDAGALLNLIPGDIGRPFRHIASNLVISDWDRLLADVRQRGLSIEREVADRDGHRYSLRLRPYTLNNTEIVGVLVMLIDTDTMQRALEQAQQARMTAFTAERRSDSILNSLRSHVAVLDQDGTISETNEAWNRFAKENGNPVLQGVGAGANYLKECDRAISMGVSGASEARDGILSVLQGRSDSFLLEYPCHSPTQQRWFLLHVAPFQWPKGGAVVAHLDISDRKAAELAAQRSDATIRALLESAAQPVIAVNADRKIVFANTNTEKIFGYAPKELLGLEVELLIPEGLRQRHSAHHKIYFDDAQTRQMGIGLDLRGRRKDGSTFPLEIGLSAIDTPDGKLGIAFVNDITERKKMEEALRESDERLKFAVEGAGLGTFDFNPKTRKRIWSDTLRRQFGFPPDTEMDDAAILQALHPDDRKLEGRIVDDARRTPEGMYATEFRVIGHGDGEERWISAFGRVLFDNEGLPARIVGVTRDLTERKRLEEVLHQRELEVSTVLDGTPDIILRLDRQFRYKYVNSRTAAVAGIPRESFLGKTSEDLGLPQYLIDLWRAPTLKTFETGKPQTLEFSYPSPGTPTEWEERFIPEFGSNGAVSTVLIIGRDVTERNRLERIAETNRTEIRALAASLITAQEEERRRVARELHDQICQQLASLAIDIGDMAANPAPKDRERRLREIQAGVIKASDVTRHIAYDLHPSVLDDLGLVASLRGLGREFLEKTKNIKLKFTGSRLKAPVPREVASCIYRITQESLQNIAKHAKAKNISITLALRKGNISLVIEDDGGGFDQNEVKGRGGLGMIGMEERARLIHGTLRVTSKPGRGTRIALEVPSG